MNGRVSVNKLKGAKNPGILHLLIIPVQAKTAPLPSRRIREIDCTVQLGKHT